MITEPETLLVLDAPAGAPAFHMEAKVHGQEVLGRVTGEGELLIGRGSEMVVTEIMPPHPGSIYRDYGRVMFATVRHT
ncbi:MAG: hypothetical protein ACE5GB_12505 [Acidimicrobiales bacterium]